MYTNVHCDAKTDREPKKQDNIANLLSCAGDGEQMTEQTKRTKKK
jgi:hypothetical protein